MNETFDLTVLPVKPPPVQNELKRPVDERLPDINAGAMVLLISPVKTGKSTILARIPLTMTAASAFITILRFGHAAKLSGKWISGLEGLTPKNLPHSA